MKQIHKMPHTTGVPENNTTQGQLEPQTSTCDHRVVSKVNNPTVHINRWFSAGPGALAGFATAFCIFGFSIVAVPGLTILGAIIGANIDRIASATGTIYQYSAYSRCDAMEQEMEGWKETDERMKEQVTQTIEQEKWSIKKTVDFFWNSPHPHQIQSQKNHYPEDASAYTQAREFAADMLGTASTTTLGCVAAGIIVAPAVSFLASPFLPKLPLYALGFTTGLATITYSIPIGICLAITFPFLQKASHGLLLANKQYRNTHYQYEDLRLQNSFHNHWAQKIETIGAKRT